MITGGPPFFSLRGGATGGKVALPTTSPPVAPTPPPLPVPPPVQLKFLVGNNLKPPWPPTLSPYYLPAMVMARYDKDQLVEYSLCLILVGCTYIGISTTSSILFINERGVHFHVSSYFNF